MKLIERKPTSGPRDGGHTDGGGGGALGEITAATPSHDNHGLSLRSRKSRVKAIVTERLVAARQLNGYQQTEAAKLFGYQTSSQLSQWEHGNRAPPLDMLIHASVVYRVSLDYLLGVSDDPDRDPVTAARRMLLAANERMLGEMASKLADAIVYQTNLGGPTVEAAMAFNEKGQRFVSAVDRFISINQAQFEEMRGGATLQAAAEEMRQAVAEAHEILKRHGRINQAAAEGVVRQVRPRDNHPLFESSANDA